MMTSFRLVFLTAIASVSTIEVIIGDPRPEQIDDPEWTMIPDEDGHLRLVNTLSAMNEPVPFFDPDTGVLFELYTLRNPTERYLLHTGNAHELVSSPFDPSRPTRIVIHGWNSRGSVTAAFQKAYFSDGEHNINFIAVNWQAGSNTISYTSARRRVNDVGPVVARFVDFLVECGQMDPETLIVIGHSLGGHIAGLVGKHVNIGQLPMIIGLDPAAPLFSVNHPEERVAAGDARSVEIIHTAAGSLGFSEPIGDANFYPNGGRSQPGCGFDMTGTCAHSRSIAYYAESINSQVGFYGLNCGSYAEIREGRCNEVGEMIRMGGNPNATGVYFLQTNSQAPFALGNPHIRLDQV